jgi:hypothetical protein
VNWFQKLHCLGGKAHAVAPRFFILRKLHCLGGKAHAVAPRFCLSDARWCTLSWNTTCELISKVLLSDSMNDGKVASHNWLLRFFWVTGMWVRRGNSKSRVRCESEEGTASFGSDPELEIDFLSFFWASEMWVRRGNSKSRVRPGTWNWLFEVLLSN